MEACGGGLAADGARFVDVARGGLSGGGVVLKDVRVFDAKETVAFKGTGGMA